MSSERVWIGRLFWTGAGLTAVGLLAGAVALVLLAVNDRHAATGVFGVFLVAASAWVINFVALVALLAWRAMHDDSEKPTTPPR